MEINSITFNGINSLSFDMYVSGNNTFNAPEKDYSKVSVPGRNGDLLLFNNRYKNVNLEYPSIIIDKYEENTTKIRAWLLSANGYCRLEDTYHPEEFRMACFAGPIDFDTIFLEAGQTTLTFDCKPERWLKSGEVAFSTTSNSFINNPTMFNAKPLIRVYGTGILKIGTGTITINTAGTEYIDIDCDIHDCYEGSVNQNGKVTISKWPELAPGRNGIELGSGISKVFVIPRWWTL